MTIRDRVDWLRKELAEAKAQAAAWEEIALALVAGDIHCRHVIGGFCVRYKKDENWWDGPVYESESAALLAWHAEQKGQPNA